MSLWEELKSLFLQADPIEAVFKEEWISYLSNNITLYSKLPSADVHLLHEKIAQFVSTTHFEGCNDLVLTEEMIITVAGQACTLILKHPGAPYPQLRSVLLYPTTFSSVQTVRNGAGVVSQQEVHRFGESWSNGTVILAWDSVQRGARNWNDGHNVTFHEFAHQLDQEFGSSDGIPDLMQDKQAYLTWGSVLNKEFQELVEKADKGKKTVLKHYGATNKAEFFAVATETFYEKPKKMKQKHPELYEMLREYFGVDPLSW